LPKTYQELKKLSGKYGTEDERRILEEIYPNLDSISVDCGIMERTDNALVIPAEFGWNDVGSWDVLEKVFPIDGEGNVVNADYLGLESKGCVIYGNKKLIVTIGVNNIVVVDTDDAIMVCAKDKVQQVKEVVAMIKEMGRDELL
jgi:mannose-1-phosphate guanylyltransferase